MIIKGGKMFNLLTPSLKKILNGLQYVDYSPSRPKNSVRQTKFSGTRVNEWCNTTNLILLGP